MKATITDGFKNCLLHTPLFRQMLPMKYNIRTYHHSGPVNQIPTYLGSLP